MFTKRQAEPGRGEFREPTPQEIARLVRTWREMRGDGQAGLAFQAEVHERTIQRLERGERVSQLVLRQVAVALGFEPDAFIGPRTILSPEEALEQLEKEATAFFEQYEVVEIQPVEGLRSIEAIFADDALHVDDSRIEDTDLHAVAEIKDLLSDWKCIYEEKGATKRLEINQTILESIRSFEAKGYVARAGHYMASFGAPAFELPTTLLIFFPSSDKDACALKIALLEKKPKDKAAK
jgi:transcriptional regulator with XRE-family HTH domain